MNKFNRRSFLKSSLVAGISAAVYPATLAENYSAKKAGAFARVIGANEDIRYAVVGFNGRGKDHLKEMKEVKGTRLAALCDVDRNVLDREIKKCENAGETVKGY